MKKQLKNKVVSALLCAALPLSMVGCGSSAGTADADAEAVTESVQETTQETGEETEGETAKREETVTITVETFDRGNYPEAYGTVTDNRWTKMIHDKVLEELNIDLQYVAIPRSDEVTKIQR